MPTSYTKSQLARFAGVSPNAKLFPPQVVRYLADKYAIDLPR